MKHEKIIKREDGTQYLIRLSVWLDGYLNTPPRYDCDLYYKEKGKKKWLNVPDTLAEYQYRSLSMEARRGHQNENMLNYVSTEELYEAKLELWEKLKPIE